MAHRPNCTPCKSNPTMGCANLRQELYEQRDAIADSLAQADPDAVDSSFVQQGLSLQELKDQIASLGHLVAKAGLKVPFRSAVPALSSVSGRNA